jgi:uncharacterized protein YkwD
MSLLDRIRDWLRRLFGGGKPPPPPPPPPPALEEWAANLLSGHNLERARTGLPPLRVDARLSRAAQAHAERMAALDRLDHFLDGLGPEARIVGAGYNPAGYSENIAAGQEVAREVLATWLESPIHRTSVLGAHLDVGFGMSNAAASRLRYWCAVYANPRG